MPRFVGPNADCRRKTCIPEPPYGSRMAKSVVDRGRGARLATRDEGGYCWYVTESNEPAGRPRPRERST
jgi:hypothetical protein